MQKKTTVLLSFLTLIVYLINSLNYVYANDSSPFVVNGSLLKLGDNYQSLSLTSLEIPDSYQENVINSVDLRTKSDGSVHNNDTTIESIVYSKGITTIAKYQYARFKNLSSIKFLYDGTSFVINTYIAYDSSSSDSSNSITDIYIYAQNLSSCGKNTFRDMNANLRIHVVNETVKQKIIEATSTSTYYTVKAEQIEVMQLETPKSSVKLSCEEVNITYGTVGGFKPSAEVTVGDNAVENPTVTYQLYTDEACQNKYSGYEYNSSMLPVGTYYLRASVAGTDDYQGSVSNVVKVEVQKNTVSEANKTALNEAIAAANKFKEENVAEDYDSTAWDNVFSTSVSTNALPQAQSVANAIEKDLGTVTDVRVEEVTKALNNALETLKNAPADATPEWKELIREIISAQAKIESGEYTEESCSPLKEALESANELSVKTATKTQTKAAANAIKEAVKNLVVDQELLPAGKPFAKVYKGGKMQTILKTTADEELTGAAKVKVTFDCADDTEFNSYASIEVESMAAGTKSYKKFSGTGGKEGCSVELPLETVVKDGDSVEISASTWAWSEAKDYVYGITKVEFFDEDGYILKTITDKTLAQDELAKAIDKAIQVDKDTYTAESYKAVEDAIKAAEELSADATVEQINAAKAAIEAAVKALAEKPSEQPSSEPAPTKPAPSKTTAPTKVTATTRSASDVAKDKKAAVKAMKQAKITKLKVKSKTKKKINVTWKKVKKAKGYQVQVSTNKKFKKSKIIFNKLTKKKTLKITNKKIKSKKTYYVRVRAYATYKNKNGKAIKVYSKWNKKLRKVKVK